MTGQGHPAVADDARFELDRSPPAQRTPPCGGAGAATMDGGRVRQAGDVEPGIDQAPAELEVFPETEEVLGPRSALLSDLLESFPAIDGKSSASGQDALRPQQIVGENLAVAAITDFEIVAVEDLSDAIDRCTIGPHEPRRNRRQTVVGRQGFGGPAQAVGFDDHVRVDRRHHLELVGQRAESPVAAAGESGVDIEAEERQPLVMERRRDLPRTVRRRIVDHHNRGDALRREERLETGGKVVGRVETDDDGADGGAHAHPRHRQVPRQFAVVGVYGSGIVKLSHCSATMVAVNTSLQAPDARLGLRPWLQAALLSAIAMALLSPSLGAGFIWDDSQQIVDSPTIDDPRAPLRYFSLNVVSSWGSEGRGADGVDTYRPMFFVALWSIHHIDGPNPFWFHLAVVAAHLGVCLLLWTLARRWLASDLAAAAVFAAFAFHPVTSEAFLWASALSEPLSVAGLLTTVIILDRWCRDGRAPWVAVGVAGTAMLLGLLTKEAVATALPALSLYLWRVRGVGLRALAGPWTAVVIFLGLRLHALEGLQATGSGSSQRIEALSHLPVLIFDGLRALFTLQPVGVRHLYWDYRDVGAPGFVIAVLAVALLCAVAWWKRKQFPLIATAIAVLICMLAPIALITTVPGWGGFGRYLYLPWGMLLLAVADVVCRPRPAAGRRLRSVAAAAAVVFIALELIGLHHAFEVYSSQEILARASVELQPHAPDGWEWLGNHHVERGELGRAARCYAAAVAIEPGIYRPRHNLAAALLHLGQPAEALAHERAVEEIHGTTAEGAVVAAAACLALGRWDEAGRWLERGLEIAPDHPRLLELHTAWREMGAESERSLDQGSGSEASDTGLGPTDPESIL